MDPTTISTPHDPVAGPDESGRRRALLPLILTGAAALVVGLVVGGVIGWKVEQQRVRDDVANVRAVGRVTAVSDTTMNVKLKGGDGNRVYQLSDATVVDTSDRADASALEQGATVIVASRRNADGDLEATELIILPEGSTGFGN